MNTKFNEKDVPSWCRWIAVDKDGECWAFSYKPVPKSSVNEWDAKQQSFSLKEEELYKSEPPKNWKDELYTWS